MSYQNRMAKPQNIPAVGDRVALKGRAAVGTLTKVLSDCLWAYVEWETAGPKVCHLYELEKREGANALPGTR
jgi:hypothetical protein